MGSPGHSFLPRTPALPRAPLHHPQHFGLLWRDVRRFQLPAHTAAFIFPAYAYTAYYAVPQPVPSHATFTDTHSWDDIAPYTRLPHFPLTPHAPFPILLPHAHLYATHDATPTAYATTHRHATLPPTHHTLLHLRLPVVTEPHLGCCLRCHVARYAVAFTYLRTRHSVTLRCRAPGCVYV